MSFVDEHGGSPAIFPFAGDSSYQLYHCSQCGHEVMLPMTSLLATQFITAMLTIFGSVWFLLSGNLTSLFSAFSGSLSTALIAALFAVVGGVLFLGGSYNSVRFVHNFHLRHQVPLCEPTTSLLLRLFVTFLFSLVPWIYWFGMGFLNDIYMHIDNDWAILLVFPGFLPFYFAERFGIPPTILFFLSASYPTAGFIFMWLS